MDELKHSLSMEISRCPRQECLHTWIIWINLCPWPVVFEFALQEPIRLHTIVSCTFLHDWLCCAKKPVFSKVLDIHTGSNSSQCIIRDDSFKIIAVHRSSIDTPREEPCGPKTPSTTEDICRCGWRVTQATFRSILADQWLEFHCQMRPTDDQQYFFSWFSPPPSTIPEGKTLESSRLASLGQWEDALMLLDGEPDAECIKAWQPGHWDVDIVARCGYSKLVGFEMIWNDWSGYSMFFYFDVI